MSKIYTSLDQLIGRTPLLELSGVEKKFGLKAKVIAKLEYFNPAGSVKDRIAKAMLDDAEASGKLKPGGIFIATTSLCSGRALDKWFYANPRAGHCLLYSAAALDLAAAFCGLQHIAEKENWHVFRKRA